MSASHQLSQRAAIQQTPDLSLDQREALKQSEKRAAENHPGTFDERSLKEKIVEIPPKEETNKPIRGLDPDGQH